MQVKAKFVVEQVTKHASGFHTVECHATNKKDGDNTDWSKWTPTGKLTMTITNEPAVDVFKAGKCVWLTIEPIDEPEGE